MPEVQIVKTTQMFKLYIFEKVILQGKEFQFLRDLLFFDL